MKMKHVQLFAAVLIAGLIIAGCKKKKGGENEEELITTVKLTLTPVGVGTVKTFTWKDVDGDGGNAPVIDSIKLSPGLQYNCELQFLDESKNPAEDKTGEVVAEGGDHQVYYEPAAGNVTISNLNKDGGGLPLGTTSTWASGTAGTNNIVITLKHKPGVKAAGDAVTKGETDVQVAFPLKIQ